MQTIKAFNRVLEYIGLRVVRCRRRILLFRSVCQTKVSGFTIDVPSRSVIANHYIENTDYSAHLGVLLKFVASKYPEGSALDVGANVGDTACILKAAVPDYPLLCVEGDPLTFPFLEKNIRQFAKTEAAQFFLGERSETLFASISKQGWNGTIHPSESEFSQKIDIISLDDLLESRQDTNNFHLLKIDAEGFDCRILRGSRRTIQRVHPVICFEYNRDNLTALGEEGIDTLEMLEELGYTNLVLHDSDGRFFSAGNLKDKPFVRDIHDYSDGKNGAIYYFDFTVFHQTDSDIADEFLAAERQRRSPGFQKDRPE